MKELVVFSMKSCPFCQIMKDKLNEENPDQRVTPMAPDRDYKTIEEGIEKVKNLL